MAIFNGNTPLTLQVRQCEARLMDAMVVGENELPFELGNTTMTLTGMHKRA